MTVVNTYVYSEASTSSSPLGGIYAGTQVTVHMYNDAWAFISLNGNYGFCPLSVLQRSDGGNTSDPLEGYYRGSAASMMYADDSTASNALASLSAGDVVTVTAYNAQWAYVTANGQSGFAPLRYLISDANTVITEMGAIVTRNAQVYEASMTSSASMGSVSRGDILTVLAYSYNRDFAYVRNDNNGAVGYMSLSALTPYDTGATSTPSTGDGIPATVTVDSLYVYRAPSTSADRYGIIYRGEEVEVLELTSPATATTVTACLPALPARRTWIPRTARCCARRRWFTPTLPSSRAPLPAAPTWASRWARRWMSMRTTRPGAM